MSRFPAPLALLARLRSQFAEMRVQLLRASQCTYFSHCSARRSSRELRISRGPSSTTSLFADKSLWYTLQRLKSTHTHKKVRFVCWTHRQKMPTTRPTIAVSFITIFADTRAVCVHNTKLQPLTRGIPNVEPGPALTLDADMTFT